MSSCGTQDSLRMEKKEGSKTSLSDIMICRLKNRERQRRYRARKRLLDADNSTKPCILHQPYTMRKAEPNLDGDTEKFITRVYCKRDWKKDARRAHMINKVQDNDANDFSVNLPQMRPIGEIPEGSEKSTSLINCEMQKTGLGRRDWKAEARNKKN